ncbi:MAG: phosphorylase, partial [Planctomycetes bacterium]|nr:phosphorylase [Planctomycetota bacterium]
MSVFPPGTLWQCVERTSQSALRQGALQPIRTEFEFLEDGGIRFFVRVVENLERKARDNKSDSRPGGPPNPFLPYDPALYVADAGPDHVCLLNKFNVVDHHLLIVTRHFEHQETPLNERDFAAWWHCLKEYDSLVFYNAG